MIRTGMLVALLAVLGYATTVRAQGAEPPLDSLMDTKGIPKPLLDVYAKAYRENWVWFGAGMHQDYFFIPRTVRTTPHGTKTVWGVCVQGADSTDWFSSRAAVIEQRSRLGIDPDLYAKYLLTKLQWEIDCVGQRVRVVQLFDYDEDGNPVRGSGQVTEKFQEPVPDSNGEGLMRAFCDTKHRITFRDIVSTPMGVPVSARP